MPKLVMTRAGDRDIQHRYAVMSLDGEFLCRVRFKETHTHEMSVGEHVLEGKNELGKKSEISFNVAEGETIYVHLEAIPTGCFALLMWVFPPAPDIFMTIVDGPIDV